MQVSGGDSKETASRGALLLDISGVSVDKPDSSQRFSKLSRQLLGASSDRLQENSQMCIRDSAGSDSTHMEDFHNPDGTMRSADDITAMWKAWNIKPDQQVSFYCGTGWRASETFMYARAMGWKNVSVYDGGWYEWSSDPKNPVATGERGPDSSK